MSRSNLIVCICIMMVSFAITAFNNSSLAKSINSKATIYETSINWEDQIERMKLLQSVPKWHDDVIKLLFEIYLHPTRYQLKKFTDNRKYTVQFINAFWGPVTNPFTKYQRPTKAFLFISHPKEPETFYLAPLIQNLDNGKYYVFDKDQPEPMILDDWIKNIKSTYNNQTTIRFNVCNGYGNLPTDSCGETYYQNEVSFINQYKLKGDRGNHLLSAHRAFNEDWRTKVKPVNFLKISTSPIINDSIDWADLEARNHLLDTVIAWPSHHLIEDAFKKLRDLRYFTDADYQPFLRRISWLYPDDGCWTRASAAIRDLFGPFNNIVNQLTRPSKIFVFGNLCANSTNSPSGYVSWWYHTAPIVRDAETNQTYVLDPSVNPYAPLSIEQWIAEITSGTGACFGSNSYVSKFAICNGFGTHPYESCQNPIYVNFATETHSMLDQREYQIEERERQIELGRDANQVLGDFPPWQG